MKTREPLWTGPFTLSWAANLAHGMAFSLFIHFPGFLQDLGAEEVQIGIIIGITAASSIAVRPWIGRIMDTRGRRTVILAGNLVNIVTIALYLTVDVIGPWLYLIRVVHGFSEAALFTALFTYAADVVPRSRRTEGLALFGVSGLLPIALGGLLGDLVLSLSTFDTLFITALSCAVVALALSIPLRDSRALDLSGGGRLGFTAALSQRDLLPLWWITGAFSLVLTGYFTFLKTFVEETGIGSVGLFFAAYSGTAILLRIVGARLPEIFGPRRVLYPAIGSLGAGFLVLAAATGAPHVALAGVLCGAGHGFMFPILYSFVITRAREADRGSAVAIFTSLFDVGLLIGGPLLGGVIRLAGYGPMYVTAAGLLGIAAGVYAVWDRQYDAAPMVVSAG